MDNFLAGGGRFAPVDYSLPPDNLDTLHAVLHLHAPSKGNRNNFSLQTPMVALTIGPVG